MKTTECTICEKHINVNEKKCPHCGSIQTSDLKKKQKKKGRSILTYIILLAVGIFVYDLFNYHFKEKKTELGMTIFEEPEAQKEDTIAYELTKGSDDKDWVSDATSTRIKDNIELYTDQNGRYSEGSLGLSTGLSLNRYTSSEYGYKYELRVRDLNLMVNEVNLKDEYFDVYIDNEYLLSFKSSNSMYPEIDSTINKEAYYKVVRAMSFGKTIKFEGRDGRYVVYDIENFKNSIQK